MLEVFQKGYHLLFKSLEVWLIYLGMNLVGLVVGLFPLNFPWNILTLIIGFISTGYLFISPVYFKYKQDHKNLTVNYLFDTLFKNLKRLILPFLLLGIIFAVIFIVVLIVTIISHGGKLSTVPNLLTVFNFTADPLAIPRLLVLAFIYSLLTFAGIYFAVEGQGFLKSVGQSIKLATKHWNFILSVMIIFFLSSFITGSLTPTIHSVLLQADWKIKQFVITALSHFVSMGIAATSLVYYQKVKK